MIQQEVIEKVSDPNSKRLPECHTQLTQLFKRSWLIKNGIFVYLKHLIPFFSRITNMPSKHYNAIKSAELLKIRERVGIHMEQLKFLYEIFAHMSLTIETIVEHINIEELQEIMQPEIDKEKLTFLFDFYGKAYAEQTHSYKIYLDSIHSLEQCLCENYKEIAEIYAKARSLYNPKLPSEISVPAIFFSI